MSLSSPLSPATVEMHQPCCDALLGMVQAKVAPQDQWGRAQLVGEELAGCQKWKVMLRRETRASS